MDIPDRSDLARRFCQYHLARRGFRPGSPPEAAELLESSDYVLTFTDGFNVHILCVLAYDKDSERTFELSPEKVFDIARACRIHAGRIGFRRGFVFVSLVEIGPASSKERQDRLQRYLKWGIISGIFVVAYSIEEGTRTVWTNAPLLGGVQRRLFQSIVRDPRLLEEEPAPQVAAFRKPVFPMVTVLMAALLAGVFLLEMAYGHGPPINAFRPSLETLVGFGGLMGASIWAGEWHRLVMAPLLHASGFHLFLNVLVLCLSGRVFEQLVGRAWFAATFVLSALGGAIDSLLWMEDNVVTVGASGAISGLLAAGFLCTYRIPLGPKRSRMQAFFLSMLIPALIPHQGATALMRIDFGAHLGGAVTGALIGWFLLRVWPASMPLPRLRKWAMGVVAAGAAGLAAPSMAVSESYRQQTISGPNPASADSVQVLRQQTLLRELIPSDRIPETTAEWAEQADRLVAQYPKDPRVRLARAINLARTNSLPEAERELREGLSQEEILRNLFAPEIEMAIRSLLALVLDAQNKPEAVKVAMTVCGKADAEMQKELNDKGLCP